VSAVAWVAVGVFVYAALVTTVLLVMRAGKRADAAMEESADRRIATTTRAARTAAREGSGGESRGVTAGGRSFDERSVAATGQPGAHP
jgi:hypothetical protein